ncbi:MAG: RND transporter [Gammaproteobacteria bacterium]|nr:RND transporter [Gammaproteobacteria bacterium]
MITRLAEWTLRLRWLLIPLLFVLALLAGAGAGKLHFTNDYQIFFSKENPQLLAFERLQDTYTQNDNILFVLAPDNGAVFSRDTLAAVEWLTGQAWQIPYSLRVDSISNFQHTYAEADDLVVENLVSNAAELDPAEIERIRSIALSEPLLINRLIAPDAEVTGVNVVLQLPGENLTEETPEAVAHARDLVERFQARYPGIEVYTTGMVMMNNAFSEETRKDMATLVPAMFALIFVILLLLLRSLTASLATFVAIGLSILTAMGLAGWFGITLSPPSAFAPQIIMTLALANCVHVLVNFLHNMRLGHARRQAMLESLRINIQPIFLTSLTTAIGFLSMNFSDAPPFRDLGNIVAMGMGAAFVASIFLLPGLMLVLPLRVRPQPETRRVAMDRLAEFCIRRKRPLLWGMSALILLLIAFIPRNELNDEFVKYFDPSIEFRAHTDFAVEHLTGMYTIEYSLPAGEPGGIADPGFLRRVEAFADWYRQQPRVMHVNTYTDIMKRLNMNLHGDDPDWYRLPRERELAAQYLLLYEMSLPYGLDLNNQINVDKSATRLTVTVESMSSNDLLALEARAQAWLQEHAPEQVTEGASPTVMFAHIGKRNIQSMLGGTTLALVLISMILVLALRSLRIGLISLVPNLVPAAMAFGLWGLLVGQVGLALSVVTGMTLGIVVDDTVHFLSKYLRARREQHLSSERAVRYAFHTVGTALWMTTLILAAGFLVLAQSAFEVNAGMGMLSAMTILLALLADFLLLPPLLMALDRRRNY